MDQKSIKYFNELENISDNKERFGLFSQPPGLAIGDKYHRPKTQAGPRAVLTNPSLKSQATPPLFQFPNFTSISKNEINQTFYQDDPYKEPFKIKQIEDKKRIDSMPYDKPFKNTDVKKTICNSEYEHMKEFNDKVYKTRDENGNIITKPKNFYTQPIIKGQGNTTVGHLFQPVSYEVDPFQRPKELDVQERATHKGKILDQDNHYVTTLSKNQAFVGNRDTYGLDRPITEGMKRTYQYPGVGHQKPWRNSNPPKQGYNKTIEKFPDYLEEGQKIRMQKTSSIGPAKGAWKPNSNGTFFRPNHAISKYSSNINKCSRFRM